MIGTIYYPPDKKTIRKLDSVSFISNFIFFPLEITYSTGTSKWEFLINRSDGTFLKKSYLSIGSAFESRGKCYKTKAKNMIY